MDSNLLMIITAEIKEKGIDMVNSIFRPEGLVRDGIKELIPYHPVDYPGVIKLDANENPFDFPPEITRQIFAALGPQSFTRYPDAMAEELLQEIALHRGVPVDHIMAGNGSDELILNLMLTFGAGNRVIIATPTFSMYGIHARVSGAEVVEINREDNFDLPVEKIIHNCEGAGLVVICSPNNPTGNSATMEQVNLLLDHCNCPVVVDQAYVEFGGTDFLPLLAKYPNLVILRTFSKAYGLAGLRVGYLISSPEVLSLLLKVKQPYNLNTFSQLAALVVLRNSEIFTRHVEQIVAAREQLFTGMQQIQGVRVYPSEANYLLFSTSYPATDIFQELLEHKVLVRSFSDPSLSGCLRVTVGQPRENEIFLSSLRKVITILGEKFDG